jgi:hypothetical protein
MALMNCPTVHEDVIPLFNVCSAVVPEDGVDAYLDSRAARCDCLTECGNADRDPEVEECMVTTLQAEVDMLGPTGPTALRCITKFWRQSAVCFGNELSCDGPATACDDIPPTVCAISGSILDDCLTL